MTDATDLIERLRRLYVQHGTNYVQEAADEIERLRAVVSALAFQANRDPFTTIGHWCEHGPCAAIIRDVSNPYADHHGPDWTQRDSEYLK